MIAEIAPWAIVLGVIGFGWWRIERHGAAKGEREQAEEERDEALKRLKTTHRADLDPEQRDRFIDRL